MGGSGEIARNQDGGLTTSNLWRQTLLRTESFVKVGYLTQSFNTERKATPGGVCDIDTNSEKPSRPDKVDWGEVGAGM